MPSREDLIPLIGLKVSVEVRMRRDSNRTITTATLIDVGTKSIFLKTIDGVIYEIDPSDLIAIKYMKEESLRGPFDGNREPGDNRGG